MLIGIISGTYSWIFIASPVLTAWKEREPGFARRRARIAEMDGTVPAFADDVALAKLRDDAETDVEINEMLTSQQEPQPKAGAVATAEPPVGDGAGPSSNGEPPAVDDPAVTERRERNERRRERRKQRRKHGRNR